MREKLLFLLVAVVLPACGQVDEEVANGDDPIEALAVPHVSERYSVAYWTQTRDFDEDLWTRAVEFCEDVGGDLRENPNCQAVLQVRSFEQIHRVPLDQPDTFDLMMKPMAPDTFESR